MTNFAPLTLGSSPTQATAVGATAFFTTAHIDPTGAASGGGYDLWKTDGTADGTTFVSHPWTAGPTTTPLVADNGALFYTVPAGATATELYKLDPSTNTTTTLTPFTFTGTVIKSLAPAGSSVFFAVNEGNGYDELWVTAGTPATTTQLTPPSHFVINSLGNLTNVNGTLYFTANDGTHGLSLWKSDGTAAGTTLVATVGTSSTYTNLTAVNGTLFFGANDGAHGLELWKSDGTTAGTAIVADIAPGTGNSQPSNLTNVNGTLYFTATDGPDGIQLWKSDGTAAGTTMVLGPNPAPGSNPSNLTALGGKLIYAATDSAGTELWVSDGTAAGTSRLADLNPGSGSSSPSQLTAVPDAAGGGNVFFTATDGTHGTALYKTDGTPAGTVLVQNINNGNGQITGLAAFNGELLFSATDVAHGSEPWISDGTAAGTTLLRDINTFPKYSQPGPLYPFGQKVVFNVPTGISQGLWSSDGTPATAGGPQSLPAPQVSLTGLPVGNTPGTPTAVTLGNAFYFNGGGNLWRTDGTPAGTQLVQAMTSSQYPYNQGQVSDLTVFKGRLFFSGTSSVGDELWTSDGTTQGTYLLDDLSPGTTGGGQQANGSPRQMTVVGDTLYFHSGSWLYQSDGTAAGTVKVAPGTSYGTLFGLTGFNGALYFAGVVGNGFTNPLLWKASGDAAGIVQVTAPNLTSLFAKTPFAVFHNALYFDGYDTAGNLDLWKLDAGDSTGTPTIALAGTGATVFAVSGDNLFFTSGGDLWAVNASGAASMLHSFPGATSVTGLTDVNGTLYFAAPGGLWQSDGTAAGTQPVAGASGTVTALADASGNLYFVNDDGTHGPQVWEIPAPLVVPAAPSALAATAPSGNEIDLTWSDNSGNEAGFHLQRSTSPTFATIDATFDLPPDTAQFADKTVQPGQAYYYRLTSYDAAGDSAAVTASASTPAAPAAPTNLTAATPSGTEVDLTFADNSDNETGFVVQRSPHPTFDVIDQAFTLPASPGTAVSYADTTVAPITTYYYRAYAVNAAGRSGYTNTVGVNTANAVPAAPTGLTAMPLPNSFSPGQVLLTWSEAAPNATGYVVERRTLPGGSFAPLTTQSPVPSGFATYSDATAAVGARYAYRVYAVNAAGTPSAYSNEASVTDAPLASMVSDIHATSSSSPSWLTPFDGALYFAAGDAAHGRELWRSDGTAAGTVLVKDIAPGGASSSPANLTVVSGASGASGDTLFFSANDGAGTELWKSDGTAAGTVLVKNVSPASVPASFTAFAAAGNTLYFVLNLNSGTSQSTYQLWQSDGTAAGTFPTPGAAAPFPDSNSNPRTPFLVPLGNAVYFSGFTSDAGHELWKAGPSGASMVADLFPGGGSNPYDLLPVNGKLYFFASPAPSTYELYRVDPAASPGAQVTSVYGGSAGASELAATSDGSIYFVSTDSSGVTRLFKSDGTAQGTAAVGDLGRTFLSDNFDSLFGFGDSLYFLGGESPYGSSLYRTDCTAAGTSRVFGPIFGQVVYTADGGQLFFNRGTSLYATDGTPAGTRFVAQTDAQDVGQSTTSASAPGGYADRAVVNGTLFFPADPTGGNRELWQVAAAATTGSPAAVPAAPSDVAAALPSPAAVVLSWTDNATNESGFWIDRSRTADFSTIDATFYAPAGAASYTDEGYPPGATVYYRVRAFNAAGESANVAAAAVATPPSAVLLNTDATTQGTWKGKYGALAAVPFQSGYTSPAAELTLSAAGQTAVSIATTSTDPRALQDSNDGFRGLAAWTAPTSFTVDVNDTAGVTRQLALYMVDWDNAGRSQRVDEIDPATGNTIASQTVSDFSAGQWPVFTVTGHVQFRFTSLSGPGAVLNGVFLDASAPATPPSAFNGLTTSSPPGMVSLTWADKAGNEQGYTIERSTDGVHFTQIGSVGPGNGTYQSYVDATAQQDVNYYYRVRAFNAAGVSPYTPPILAQAGWVRPDQLAVYVGTDTTTGGSWMGTYAKGGPYLAIAGDSETMTLAGETEITWASSTSDPRALQKTNPTNGDRVAAAWSSPTSFTMSPPWSTNSGRYSIYAVDWDNAGRVERFDVIDNTTNQVLDSRTISNFQNGTYVSWNLRGNVRIVVTCLAGPNAVVSGYFADNLYAPAAPSNLSATPAPGQVNLTWSDNSNNEEGFRIERSYDAVNFSQIGTVGPNVTTFSDTTGTPGLVYYYRVRAYNSWGPSDPSGTASATDPDSDPSNVVRAASLAVAPAAAFAVDDGSGQQSVVRSLTVTFNTPVTLSPGALTLAQRAGPGGAAGGDVPLTVSNPTGDGRTYLLTFPGSSGPALQAASLPDGVYDLTVHAALVSNDFGPAMAADTTFTFHRLFGDADGNGTVNALDYARFKQSFGSSFGAAGYNAALDFDGNGSVNALDYAQFKKRFGVSIPLT